MSVAPQVGQCPNCGAEVKFRVGSSRVSVCESCHTAVARKGQDFTAIGQVADLIPTGSKLELGLGGRYDGHAFTLVGRVQMEWQGGVWDEWHTRFDDGRWGWVAEAQGRYYVLFKIANRPVPDREDVSAGAKVFLPGLGRFVVSDVKDAKLASCAGELPDEILPDSVGRSADLEGAQQGFGTIDYGAPGDAPQIFVGHQASLEELGLGERAEVPTRGARPTGEALKCPQCNGAVELRMPDQTLHVACSYCGSLLDVTQGALQIIQVLKRHATEPAIPLGTKGKLNGLDLMVVGWMQRTCVVEGSTYEWDEFLLYRADDTSFRWLLEQDGHWSLVEPLSAGEIEESHDVSYRGRRFKRFGEVTGKVKTVLGEFYWQVKVGDEAELIDYIAPPNGISYERAGKEVNWSYSTYLEPSLVAEAFGRPQLLKRSRRGVAPIQPWPHEAAYHSASHWSVGGMVLVTLIFFGMLIGHEANPLLVHRFSNGELQEMSAEAPEDLPPGGAKTHSYLSEPFAVPGREPLTVSFSAPVNNGWAASAGAIIDEATGDSAPFSLEAEYYSGVEDGESWSEGDRSSSTALSALPAGNYVLRADLMWDPKLSPPPAMEVRVESALPSPWHWLAALALLSLPFALLYQRSQFESSRWWNSNLDSSSSSGDDS